MSDTFGSTSFSSTPTAVFDTTSAGGDSLNSGGLGPCTTYTVVATAGNIFVSIGGLHPDGQFWGPLPLNFPMPFRAGKLGITKVTVKSDGSGGTANGGVEVRL